MLSVRWHVENRTTIKLEGAMNISYNLMVECAICNYIIHIIISIWPQLSSIWSSEYGRGDVFRLALSEEVLSVKIAVFKMLFAHSLQLLIRLSLRKDISIEKV